MLLNSPAAAPASQLQASKADDDNTTDISSNLFCYLCYSQYRGKDATYGLVKQCAMHQEAAVMDRH